VWICNILVRVCLPKFWERYSVYVIVWKSDVYLPQGFPNIYTPCSTVHLCNSCSSVHLLQMASAVNVIISSVKHSFLPHHLTLTVYYTSIIHLVTYFPLNDNMQPTIHPYGIGCWRLNPWSGLWSMWSDSTQLQECHSTPLNSTLIHCESTHMAHYRQTPNEFHA